MSYVFIVQNKKGLFPQIVSALLFAIVIAGFPVKFSVILIMWYPPSLTYQLMDRCVLLQ